MALRAHEMRSAPTDSEEKLWRALSASQLGVGFRRQVPIGRYIVDFLAPAARVVVEVDGGYHERRRFADARCDAALRRAGYRVLRLDAALVCTDLVAAIQQIRGALEGCEP